MAKTTTTSLTELVNSEVINPAILDYAVDYVVAAPFVNFMDLRGKASKVGSFPRWVLDTTDDAAAETTDLTSEMLETTDVQITGAEIGLRRHVTYAALEETIIGPVLWDFIVRDSGVLAGVSLDDDICALFTSLSNAVGQATTDLSLAVMVQAQSQLRKQKMRGKPVYVLDDQQAEDYQAAQAASTSTTINGLMAPNTMSQDNGYLGTFFNAEVWQTGLCDTSNTGASVNGACFIRGDTNPTSCAFGGVLVRDITTRLMEDVPGRAWDFVMSAKWGVGEVADDAGVRIKTDA